MLQGDACFRPPITIRSHYVNDITEVASAIKRKIVLMGGACFRPPNTIKSHYVGDITRAMGEIISYHEKD